MSIFGGHKWSVRLFLSLALLGSFCENVALAVEDSTNGSLYLLDASKFYHSKHYFKSARYAFAAFEQDPNLKAEGYAWVTMGLVHAGLPNAASYFFIRTLQSGNPKAIKSVLTQTQELVLSVGADLLRKYLIRHTRYEDYDSVNRSAYLYVLGKEALALGDHTRAISYFNGVHENSPLYAYALQLRATANAILGKNSEALQDFRSCQSKSSSVSQFEVHNSSKVRFADHQADDLRSRCIAGEARTLYQMDQFHDADRVYDKIPKKSFVWPDILFEQAWTSYAKQEYNRSLGKLVSYKSPALTFLFNPEIEVLRAQSFLSMCLYSDANESVNNFNSKYSEIGIEVKEFTERNANDLAFFYELGKKANRDSLYTKNGVHQLMNRFLRGPYFQDLLANEAQISKEQSKISEYDSEQAGVSHRLAEGFPGFLGRVLQWRQRSIQLLGGAFVKNSLIDYHSDLIENFEKMSFIKLEMLKNAKDKLLNQQKTPIASERGRGNREPSRRDDQYRWSFNGEFWNDELGDYVFGLESECQG